MIITKELINKACELTRAAVQEIINDPHANWGPKWVDGKVYAPGLDKPLKFRFGEKTVWNPNWGHEVDFTAIAAAKFQLVEREKQNSSELALFKPWLVKDGEYLYSGGAHRDGITVCVSGLHGWADEAISEIFISIIIMLSRLKADDLVKQNKELL